MTVAAEEFRSKFVFLKISKNHDEHNKKGAIKVGRTLMFGYNASHLVYFLKL